MQNAELYSQFDTAYKNAKLLIIQGEGQAAREYIITCMSVMLELYKNTKGVYERAKLYAHICDFKNISARIYESGITPDIKTWFGISESEMAKPSGRKQPSQIDKIISESPIDWAVELFEKCSPSVVEITAKSRGVIASGTGFIISDKGYLLSNDHVVFNEDRCEYYKSISMKTIDGTRGIPVEVIASDKKSDVALCKFDIEQVPKVIPVKRIADYSQLRPGAKVILIGNGLSMGLAPLSGDVKFPHDGSGNLVTTVPSNHGDSGGPMFNSKGECVGINKSVVVAVQDGSTRVEAQGITNATPMDKIDKLLEKWCKQYSIEL